MRLTLALVFLIGMCLPAAAQSAYAVEVVDFNAGNPQAKTQYRNPASALGAPNYVTSSCPVSAGLCSFVSIGKSGALTLRTDISSISAPDGYQVVVHEVGAGVEAVAVEISADGDVWEAYHSGTLTPPNYVRITDSPSNRLVTGATVGPDIDAVTIRPYEPIGSALLGWGQKIAPSGAQPPGNSLFVVDLAYELRFDGLEVDVQITKDGVPVLMHNTAIDEETDGTGSVREHTFAELQQFTRGDWHEQPVRVARLEDVLNENGNRGFVLVDSRFGPENAPTISKILDRTRFNPFLYKMNAYTVANAVAYRAAIPNIEVYYKHYGEDHAAFTDAVLDQLAAGNVTGIMVEVVKAQGTIAPLVERAHARGLKVITFVHYSNHTLADLQRLVSDRVDVILTQHPEWRDGLVPAP